MEKFLGVSFVIPRCTGQENDINMFEAEDSE